MLIPFLTGKPEIVYQEVIMPKIFNAIDKLKPAYDIIYKVFLFICKLLLIADIVITTMMVAGRYIPFIPAFAWSEEIILTLMSYMAVLSAALAIRRGVHIRMSAFDRFLPRKLLVALDILAGIAVLVLGIVMITEGWKYAMLIGSKAKYTSIPTLSKRWMYFPVPLAGVAMVIFQLEVLYKYVKSFWDSQENKTSEESAV